jgi:signal recognition particle receptor subunit beta
MPFINHETRELNFKIVYCGPPLSGKTTNLQWIYDRTPLDMKGKLTSLATENDRILFFDFRSGAVRGYDCRLHLYTVPGIVHDEAPQVLILKGVDGIVFVADSQKTRAQANAESLARLEANLAGNGNNLANIPMVLQYNKRDLPDASSVAELDAVLNRTGRMRFEACAVQGSGVLDPLNAIARQALQKLSAS